MITLVKSELARIISDALQTSVKIQTSGFTSDENRAVKDAEVYIDYKESSWNKIGKGKYTRNYTFEITVRVKNLKTNNELLELTDFICYTLLTSNVLGRDITIEQDSNEGKDSQSIWEGLIRIFVPIQEDKNTPSCDFAKTLDFNSISINLFPSYSHPLQ